MVRVNGAEVEFTADRIERNTRKTADNSDAIRKEIESLRARQTEDERDGKRRFVINLFVTVLAALLSYLLSKFT